MGQFAFPRGGMGSIAESMAARARAKGAEVRVNAPVQRVARGEGPRRRRRPRERRRAARNHRPVQRRSAPDLPVARRPEGAAQRSTWTASASSTRAARWPASSWRSTGCRTSWACRTGEGPAAPRADAAGRRRGGLPAGRRRPAVRPGPGRLPDRVHHPDASTTTPWRRPASTSSRTGIQQLPFELETGTWDDYKDTFTRNVIDVMESYAPGIKDSIIGTATITPLDLEREYGLPGGNIFHGAMTLGQLYASRPIPGLRLVPVAGAGALPVRLGHPSRAAASSGRPGTTPPTPSSPTRPRAAGRVRRVRAASSALKSTMAQRMMSNPRVRKMALPVARQSALSKIVDRFSKR